LHGCFKCKQARASIQSAFWVKALSIGRNRSVVFSPDERYVFRQTKSLASDGSGGNQITSVKEAALT